MPSATDSHLSPSGIEHGVVKTRNINLFLPKNVVGDNGTDFFLSSLIFERSLYFKTVFGKLTN